MKPHTNWLQARASSSPSKIAIIDGDEKLTYSELYTEAIRYTTLSHQKFKAQSRIAIMLPTQMDSLIMLHGLAMSNFEIVLINYRLTASEIRWQLDYLDVHVLISHSRYNSTLEKLEDYIIQKVDQIDNLPSSELIQSDHSFSDILCYVFTSGTTGRPKAVPLSFSNFFYSALSSAYHLGTVPEDKWLLTIPIFHLGGLAIVFRTCLYGTTLVCHDGFDVDIISEDIMKRNITQLSLVPVMLKRLLGKIPKDNDLRFVLIGGAAADEQLLLKAQQQSLPAVPTYGMTETTSQFATSSLDLVRDKPNSVGKPLLFSSIKILNPDSDGIGEILVKGPVVTKGYANIVTEITDDGYFPTGDLGYLDKDGDLFIVQRRKDLIISGGENVYPSEVERKLAKIEDIIGVCVIGVDDDEWGQKPIAVLETSRKLQPKDIISTLRQNLAGYKIPRTYYLMDKFPRTASGKIIRSEIKDQLSDLKELEDE